MFLSLLLDSQQKVAKERRLIDSRKEKNYVVSARKKSCWKERRKDGKTERGKNKERKRKKERGKKKKERKKERKRKREKERKK